MNLNLLFTFSTLSPLLLRALHAENFLDTSVLEQVDSSNLSQNISNRRRQLQNVGTLVEIMNAGNLIRITGENLNWTSNQPSDYSIFYLPLPPVEGTVLPQDSTCFVYTLDPAFVQTACSYSDLVNYYFVDCVAETTVYSLSDCTNAITGGPTFAPTEMPTVEPSFSPTAMPTAPTKSPSAYPSIEPSPSPTAIPSVLPSYVLTVDPTIEPSFAPSTVPTTSAPTVAPTPSPTSPTPLPTAPIPGTLLSVSNNGNKVQLNGVGLTWLGTNRFSYVVARFDFPPTESTPIVLSCGLVSVAPTAVLTGCNYAGYHAQYFADCDPSKISVNYSTTACTNAVTGGPTFAPTTMPTLMPTQPTAIPTSSSPTMLPTGGPTPVPSGSPTLPPTAIPSVEPTIDPSISPSVAPTERPSTLPTAEPTLPPSDAPTVDPTIAPTPQPTPSCMPTYVPSTKPTVKPTRIPTTGPSFFRPPLTGHNATNNATNSAPATEKNKANTFIQSPAGISVVALGGLTVAAVIGRTLWSCYGKRTQLLQNNVVINPLAYV